MEPGVALWAFAFGYVGDMRHGTPKLRRSECGQAELTATCGYFRARAFGYSDVMLLIDLNSI